MSSGPSQATFGTSGSSWIVRPMPWPVSSAQTLKPRRSTSACTAAPIAPTLLPAVATASPRRSADWAAAESRCSRGRRADRDGAAGVGVVAVELGGDVELDQLAVAQAARARDAVDALVVDGDADRAGEVVGQRRGGAGAVGGEDPGGDVVELLRRDRRAAPGAPSPGSPRRPRGPRRAERPAHQGRRWTPCHPHRSMSSATFSPAVARRRARAHDRFTGPRRQRCRPPRGLRGLRGRGRARRPRARGGRQVQEGVRRGAGDRDRRALARAHPRVRRPPGRAVAGALLRDASSRSRPSRSRTRCAGSASSTASSSSRSSPPSSSGATATSSSTRSARARTASSCAASTRPVAGTTSFR